MYRGVWDHPHVCGEYSPVGCLSGGSLGSPPRVWGIRSLFFICPVRIRITPTCVGNTAGRGRPLRPRCGSPPRVWGIPQGIANERSRKRITPTCVGNTRRRCGRGRSARDHPHVCGEYLAASRYMPWVMGSPPRVWGIPPWPSPSAARPQDHPHVCGEYTGGHPRRLWQRGSPPRVWGILWAKSPKAGTIRITPTCVGNTRAWPHRTGCPWDHPHVCGEYCFACLLRG